MARDIEFALLGGVTNIVQPDALDGFGASIETGINTVIETKWHQPVGPAGELVGRRMFLQVTHRDGFAFLVTPIVDGRYEVTLRTFFSAQPTGVGDVRTSLLLPLGRFFRGRYTVGLRGTSFGARLEAVNPNNQWHWETLVLEGHALHEARGLAVSD